jgi:multiple sugar transport system substrate-binding protein
MGQATWRLPASPTIPRRGGFVLEGRNSRNNGLAEPGAQRVGGFTSGPAVPHIVLRILIPLLVLFCLWYSERMTAPKATPGRVEVVYWEKWTEIEADAMRAVVDAFNRSQSRVYVHYLSISGIDQKTLLAVAAGNPPDIAGLWSSNIAQYADDFAIIPLDKYCHQYGIDRSHYIPIYWDNDVYNGHVYGLPTAVSSTALHYNTDLLRKAGLDPTHPPQTFEELDAAAAKITTRSGGHIDVAGFMPAEPGWWNWGWGYMFGGKLWDGKSRITANSQENIRAFEWVATYSRKYGPGALQTFRSGFASSTGAQNAFLSGKIAMELQGVWMHNFIQRYSPKLHWAAAPFPHPADRPDLAGPSYADNDVLVIPRGAKHPDAAFEFINFAESQRGMELLCMGQRKHSPLRKVSNWFWKTHPNPYIKLFADLAYSPNAIAQPKVGIWPELLAEMNNAFDEVALLRKTPRQALDYVQERMQPRLDAYLARQRLRDRQYGSSTGNL